MMPFLAHLSTAELKLENALVAASLSPASALAMAFLRKVFMREVIALLRAVRVSV